VRQQIIDGLVRRQWDVQRAVDLFPEGIKDDILYPFPVGREEDVRRSSSSVQSSRLVLVDGSQENLAIGGVDEVASVGRNRDRGAFQTAQLLSRRQGDGVSLDAAERRLRLEVPGDGSGDDCAQNRRGREGEASPPLRRRSLSRLRARGFPDPLELSRHVRRRLPSFSRIFRQASPDHVFQILRS
jgi:hypothetical protein